VACTLHAMFLCGNIRCLVASQDTNDTCVPSLPGVIMKQCSVCKESKYCSKTCQREAMTNGHRFSCQKLLKGATGKEKSRKEMFAGIEKRLAVATKLAKQNKLVELGDLEDSLLGDTDALLTNANNEFLIFRIYDMLALVHHKNKNISQHHRFNLMAKYIADRMPDSECGRMCKTCAYIGVGRTFLVLGDPAQSILIYTACLDFCKEHGNEQRHILTKRAQAYMDLGQYTTCIQEIKDAISIPVTNVSSSNAVTSNLPLKYVEIADQLTMLAQSFRGLGNFNRALLLQKILWHYCHVKKMKKFVYSAQSGIATVLYERALHQKARLLAHPHQAIQVVYSGCLLSFTTSLKQAIWWYIKDPDKIGGLYASTFLQLAFIYHDIAKHNATLQPERMFKRLTLQEKQTDKMALFPVPATMLSANMQELSEILAIHMASEHNTYLMKYLEHVLENGHKKCSFCEQCRSANDTLLTCTRCGVVRFCNKHHQKMASMRMSTFSGRYVIRHHSICNLLRYYVMFIDNNSVENTYAYITEQQLFLARGL
jgi:tetratricopeptide (TPR) repeat protein